MTALWERVCVQSHLSVSKAAFKAWITTWFGMEEASRQVELSPFHLLNKHYCGDGFCMVSLCECT